MVRPRKIRDGATTGETATETAPGAAVAYAAQRLTELNVTAAPAPPRRVPNVRVRNRLAHPFGAPALEVPVRDKDLVIRVVDAQLRPGRVHEVAGKGWEFVQPEDLAGTPEDFGFSVENGRIVRGERGREVLMKMHRDDWQAILEAKSRANALRVTGRKGKDALLDDVARTVGDRGDEAASFLAPRLTITDTKGPEPNLAES